MGPHAGVVETAEEKKNKSNVTVRIFGSEYPLSGVQDPRHVEELARYVDAKMTDISKSSGVLSSGKIAVLAVLNIADELFKLRARHEALKETVSARLNELGKKIDILLQK